MRWASASGPSPFRAGVVWSGWARGVPGFISQCCWPCPTPTLSGVFLSSLAYFLRSSRAADTLWSFLTAEGPGGEDGDRPGSEKRLGGWGGGRWLSAAICPLPVPRPPRVALQPEQSPTPAPLLPVDFSGPNAPRSPAPEKRERGVRRRGG